MPGLRRELRHRALLTEETDEPPHLGERLAPRRLDGLERLPLLLLVGPEQAAHGPRLHGHDGDGVRDHVVQLSRDPLALLGDGPLGGIELLALEPLRALGHLPRMLGPPADEEPGRPRDRDEHRDEEVVGGGRVEADVRPDPSGLRCDEPRDGAPRLVVRADPPGYEEDRDEEEGAGILHRIAADREDRAERRDDARAEPRRVARA